MYFIGKLFLLQPKVIHLHDQWNIKHIWMNTHECLLIQAWNPAHHSVAPTFGFCRCRIPCGAVASWVSSAMTYKKLFFPSFSLVVSCSGFIENISLWAHLQSSFQGCMLCNFCGFGIIKFFCQINFFWECCSCSREHAHFVFLSSDTFLASSQILFSRSFF